MKQILMIAIAFLTLNATAQDMKHRKGGLKDLSAEEVATLQTKKMTLELDLTEAQQAKVKALVLKEAKAMESKRAARKAKKEQEDAKRPTKEERFNMANERLDKQIEMKKQMKTILNDEQYKKWEASRSKKKKSELKEAKGKRFQKRS